MKKQKPWLGFSLALLATMTWGSLPVIAQQALSRRCAHAGVGTLFSSFAGVVCVVGADRQAAEASEFSKQTLFLLVLGIIGISA